MMCAVAAHRNLVGLLVVLGGAATACSASVAVRAADQGDRATLRGAIATAETEGRLSLRDAAAIARRVVEHEIAAAPSPEYAVARIREARACGFEVDGVLADRMRGGDVAAGEAALARLETGAVGASAARGRGASGDDRWRAVAVSGLTGSEDRDARLRALGDGSPLVRAAALHAIVQRGDPADLDAVLEAARLDPDPLLRSSAVRALAAMPEVTVDRVNRLRDLWTAGDSATREAVARVLTSPAVVSRGGQAAVAHLLGVSRDDDVVTVAAAILGSQVADAELRAAATSALAAAATDGAQRARIHALAVLPVRAGRAGTPAAELKPLLDALRAASHADDRDVRLAALGRLADARTGAPAGDRTAAVQALEALAAPDPSAPVQASRARLLLAEAGDVRVQAWVEADLLSADGDARLGAAQSLVALGRAARAAPLLADEDPSVRTQAACVILLASRLP